jgi:TIGR03009 family protein
MKLRSGLCVLTTLLALATPAWAQPQANPLRGPNPPGPTVEPDQPVRPQLPTLEPRSPQPPAAPQPVAPQPPPPPFQLTPQQEAQVDRALNLWEQRNKDIKTFDCHFKRWIYDVVFGPPSEAKFIEIGVIKYAAPDRGLFRVEKEEKDKKETPIPDARAEHWIADGKSIWEYKPGQRKLIEHKLPPELQGKAIVETPLPFLFGAEAQKLKQRYWIRIATPPNVQDQVWLEAYPRFQKDAANFHHSLFIITTQGMVPFALRVVQPNGKDFTTYQFYDIVVNDPLRLFQGDPFRAYTPLGWQKIVEEPPPPAQARRPPSERR